MSFPDFFAKVPSIRVRDGLSQVLGATTDGVMEYHYADAVRLAGHSCPTVASAWLTAVTGLKALYPEGLPERGGVEVSLPDAEDAGVTGVIGQVLTLVTGAAGANGFHGLGGNHVRQDLLQYSRPEAQGVRMRRKDTGATVDVVVDPSPVPGNPEMRQLIGKVIQGLATPEESKRFGDLWQERVARLLLEHANDPAVVNVHRL